MDTTNLRQVEGGTVIKQADRSSVLAFILQDAKGREKKLDGQTAQVALYTNYGKFWETTTKVKGSEVSFSLPGNLAVDDYLLDISVAGYVFPSDRDLIIRVTQGFKNFPDKETAERAKQTLEEITADVQKQADENLKQTITIITTKKDEFTSYVDTKAVEVSSTGDKYLKNIEATKSQSISDIRQVSKTEAGKIKASSNEAISLIGSKKDQALKEIDSKAKNISNTVKADVTNLLEDKVSKEPGKGLSDNNFSTGYKNKLDNLEKNIDKKLGLTVTRFETFLKETAGSLFMEDTLENWRKIPNGYYFVRPKNIENQPSGYGFMRVINYKGDFSVIWESMLDGPIYRKTGNFKSLKAWRKLGGYS